MLRLCVLLDIWSAMIPLVKLYECLLCDFLPVTARYSWDYVMVFEVRAEDKELTKYQRKFSMKEILTRLNAGGEWNLRLSYPIFCFKWIYYLSGRSVPTPVPLFIADKIKTLFFNWWCNASQSHCLRRLLPSHNTVVRTFLRHSQYYNCTVRSFMCIIFSLTHLYRDCHIFFLTHAPRDRNAHVLLRAAWRGLLQNSMPVKKARAWGGESLVLPTGPSAIDPSRSITNTFSPNNGDGMDDSLLSRKYRNWVCSG